MSERPSTMRERWNDNNEGGAMARAAVTCAIAGRNRDVVAMLDAATEPELRCGAAMLVATVKSLLERMAEDAGGKPSDAERMWQVFAARYVHDDRSGE